MPFADLGIESLLCQANRKASLEHAVFQFAEQGRDRLESFTFAFVEIVKAGIGRRLFDHIGQGVHFFLGDGPGRHLLSVFWYGGER